jgi:MFS family permease
MAATWVMNTLTPSPLLISLMSTVATLPFFLFTFPAGAIADMVDRRRLLCVMNLWLAIIAAGLAALVWLKFVNPYVILAAVFLLGVGFAINAPAWTAIIPEVVTKEELPAAITLGGLQLNVSGIIGPSIGGMLLPVFGANVVFAINAFCFLFVIWALLMWRKPIEPSQGPQEGFFGSFASAIRYVRLTPAIRVVVLRGALFGLFIALIPALLPVVGLKKLYLGASHLGLLFTSMAVGSVLGAVFVVPRVRASFTPNAVTILACAMLGLVYFLMGCINQAWGFMLVAALAGTAWTIAASELWVAGQNAAPDWARGRMNAVYMMVSSGSMAIGGIVWGAAATFYGLDWALHGASILLLCSLPLLFRLSIDFVHELTQQSPLDWDSHSGLEVPNPEEGPVKVTMGFQIEPSKRDQFLNLLREIRDIYLRNGVSNFRVYEDLARKHSFRIEMVVATWREHLLQQERMTSTERKTLDEVRRLHHAKGAPEIRYYISREKEILSREDGT